jgi:hypothetical protein
MRAKKSSRSYDKAAKRLAGLKSIDPKLDLGNGMTVASFEQELQDFQATLRDYNAELSVVDAKMQKIREGERMLNEHTDRWLSAVGGHYGKDSEEYQKAGGVRKSLRKRNAKKAKLPADGGLPQAASFSKT